MFFVILEGLETDSAKSSLGFLDDLIEGHLLFFRVSVFFLYKKIQNEMDTIHIFKSDDQHWWCCNSGDTNLTRIVFWSRDLALAIQN